MPESDDVFDAPSNTREEILEATFEALCEHGYSNLTLSKIGTEFEKSTSLVYHHYDGKDELLVDLLEYLLQTYQQGIPLSSADPAAQLDEFLEAVLTMDESVGGFGRALVELRAQATHDDAYRDQFERTDELFQNQLARIVRTGVQDGSFADVDPEQTAVFLHAVIIGVHTGEHTGSQVTAGQARAELLQYVDEVVKG